MSRSTYITLGIYLAALIVVWLGVWPFWQDVQSSRSAVASLEQEIAHEQEVIERLAELEQTIAERSDRIEQIERAIPQRKDSASLIAIFEEASSNNGLALADVTISGASQQSSSVLDSFSINLELSGRYGAFTSFLDDVETSFPLLDISAISFSIPTQGGQEEDAARFQDPLFDFTVDLQTYYIEQ